MGLGVTLNPDPKSIKKYAQRIIGIGLRDQWMETDVLLIEEISMIPHTIFTVCDLVARIVRKKDKPFGNFTFYFSHDNIGGMQVIVVGDFYRTFFSKRKNLL